MNRLRHLLSFGLVMITLFAIVVVPALADTAPPAAAPAAAAATPTPPAQPADDWANAKKTGRILVGTAADYPPFEFYSSNYQLDGFDIALMKEIGKRMGVGVVFIDNAFDGLFDALRLNRVDASIAAISVTPDRQQFVDFSNLYYIGEDAALAGKSFQGDVTSPTDLAKQKVGVQRGTTYQHWAQDNLVDKGLITQTDLVAYQDVNAMVRDLGNGTIDVALMGLLPAQQFTANPDLRIAGQNFNRQKFGIATRTGSTLIDPINEALLKVQADGTYARLAKQYLGVNPSEITPGKDDQVPEPTPEPAATAVPAATATPTPPPCLWNMAYVADLNYDDKNMTAPPVMKPGQPFDKKWRIRNSGTCAWEPNFYLGYVSGNRPEAQMGAVPVPVGKRIEPGQTVDLTAHLIAPTTYGTFQAFWQMHNSTNLTFGEVVWVGIQVPNPNPPPPPPPPPPNLNPNLRADSTWINAGQCTTIRWDVDNVNAVYFIDGGNSQPVTGHDSRVVCPTVTTTYVLRVVDKSNKTTDFPITINVNNSPPPGASINFWVDNGTIDAGQCTTLRWDVKNVKAVYLNDQGVAGQGSQQVCPGSTTTYTLRVVKQDDSQETRQVTVNVNNAPPPGPQINDFSANRNEINAGECVDLRWSTTNAKSVNLLRGSTQLNVNAPANGSQPDCPPGPGLYEYELRAYGNGETSQRLSVTVSGAQPK